jgi:hypothetical protein
MQLLLPLMQGLEQVHQTGLIHRDISPENIMIQESGKAKLLDFGAVRDIGMVTMEQAGGLSTEPIVKQGYAPLEQYQKHGHMGPWTDVYGCCAVIYYCLTGTIPPDAPERALGQVLQPLSGYKAEAPEYVDDVLQHGMQIRLEDRIPDMNTLIRELYQVENGAENGSNVLRPTQEVEESAEQTVVQEVEESAEQTVMQEAGQNTDIDGGQHAGKTPLLIAVGVLAVFAVLGIVITRGSNHMSDSGTAYQADVTDLADENTMDDENAIDNETAIDDENVIEDETQEASALPVPESELLIGTAETGSCGDGVFYRYYADTGTMELYGTGVVSDYYYPEQEDGGLDNPHAPWEDYKQDIQYLIIRENVAYIGTGAFDGCEQLTYIDWGRVNEIGRYAFRNTNLSELDATKHLYNIGSYAFSGCSKLTDVILADETIMVWSSAFAGCPVKRFVAGPSLRLCGTVNPFSYSQEVYAPAGLVMEVYEGSQADDFAQSNNIEVTYRTLNLKQHITGKCGENVTYDLDLKTGDMTFSGSGRTYDYHFSFGYHNQELYENYQDVEVPWQAYKDWIRSLNIEPGITYIGVHFFDDTPTLSEVSWGTVEELGMCSFRNTGLTTLQLPDTVKNISAYAFSDNLELVSAELPNSVQTIDVNAFCGCNDMQELVFHGDVEFITEDDNYLLSRWDGEHPTTVIYAPAGGNIEAHAKQYNLSFVDNSN